jgi:hypothetical protein
MLAGFLERLVQSLLPLRSILDIPDRGYDLLPEGLP